MAPEIESAMALCCKDAMLRRTMRILAPTARKLPTTG